MEERVEQQEREEQAAKKREYAKVCIMMGKKNKAKFREGLSVLQEACMEKDPEAIFLMAKLNLEGYLTPTKESAKQRGWKLLFQASSLGSLQAKVMLTELCRERYQQDFKFVKDSKLPHPLTDFDGKPIVIQRKGLFTPIDAKLEYVNEQNILTLKCNLDFVNLYVARDQEKFREAVLKGITAWEGNYTILGGQPITVKMEVTSQERFLDSVHIYLMNDEGRELFKEVGQAINITGNEKMQSYLEMITTQKNSFMLCGKKWSVKSGKTIYVTQMDLKDSDYEEITAIVTHEFGHALGLGDLYQNPEKGMKGVAEGTYLELDSYHITDKYYHLVMCDKHGAISNNDIEMIVLAFSENAMQNYQQNAMYKKVSEALGKGN